MGLLSHEIRSLAGSLALTGIAAHLSFSFSHLCLPRSSQSHKHCTICPSVRPSAASSSSSFICSSIAFFVRVTFFYLSRLALPRPHKCQMGAGRRRNVRTNSRRPLAQQRSSERGCGKNRQCKQDTKGQGGRERDQCRRGWESTRKEIATHILQATHITHVLRIVSVSL